MFKFILYTVEYETNFLEGDEIFFKIKWHKKDIIEELFDYYLVFLKAV